ncbi:MAG: polysaccharide export protein [Candidatus Scalindua sp.]|nr:polysaccharide export protein [Candidatus Scalindua sp.]
MPSKQTDDYLQAGFKLTKLFMRMLKKTVLVFVVITIMLLQALFEAVGEKVTNASSAENQTQNNQNYDEYLLQPGDQLSIKFFYNPNLNEEGINGEGIIVLPDGRVSLQLVQGVMAAGMTVKEFTNLLKEKYSQILEKPDITVIVLRSKQKVYVGGEVEEPQMINLEGPMTVLQSILQAGGFKDAARHSKVIVIRHNVDNTRQIIPVNIKEVINGTDLTQDINLVPNDIVYVKEAYF